MSHGYEISTFHNVQTHEDLPHDIVANLRFCIRSAFGGNVTEEDASHHMAGHHVLVVHAKEGSQSAEAGTVVGFTSTSIISPRQALRNEELPDTPGAYFAGAAIAQSVQGNGLYHKLNDLRLDYALAQGSEFVYTRTQNPRVQEGITGAMDRLVGAGRIRTYEMGRIICKGAYGSMLTPTKPRAHKLAFDDIDYDKGDAVMLSWHMVR